MDRRRFLKLMAGVAASLGLPVPRIFAESRLPAGGPTDVTRRHDAIYFISAENFDPDADPSNDNRLRQDETGHGLVSPVCIRRDFRGTLPHIVKGKAGCGIYVTGRLMATAERIRQASSRMCERFYDIRAFGVVMASKVANCGQVRGPIQIGFARSVDPVMIYEEVITRIPLCRADGANFMNQTFGFERRIPFGLYCGHIYFTPKYAEKTGFSGEDFRIFWKTMARLFEHTSSRPLERIRMEQIVVFEHESPLGNVHSRRLFDMVTGPGEDGKPHLRRRDGTKPARSFSDYIFPKKEEIQKRIEAVGIRGVKVHYLL